MKGEKLVLLVDLGHLRRQHELVMKAAATGENKQWDGLDDLVSTIRAVLRDHGTVVIERAGRKHAGIRSSLTLGRNRGGKR